MKTEAAQVPPDELFEERCVVPPDRSKLPLHDLVDEGGQVRALEGLLQGGHLVQDAAQRPDVRLLVIHLHSTVQYRAVQSSTEQYSTVQYSTIQYTVAFLLTH